MSIAPTSCPRRSTGACVRLLCAVDDEVALRSTAREAGLEPRSAPGTLRASAGAAGAMVELSVDGCACALVTRYPERVPELVRRLVSAERRVQLLLQAHARAPVLARAPAVWTVRELHERGLGRLPEGEVVEIVLRAGRSK